MNEFPRSLVSTFRWTLPCAAMIVCNGCYQEIAYESPAEESQQQPEAPEVDAKPNDGPDIFPEEPVASPPVQSELEPVDEEPASPPPSPVVEAPPPEFDDHDLFGIAVVESKPTDASASVAAPGESQSPAATADTGESLLPWENEDDRYRQADQNRESEAASGDSPSPINQPAALATPTGSADSLLPWETPTEEHASAIPAPNAESESEVAPPEVVVNEQPQLPADSPASTQVNSPDERVASVPPAVQPGPTTSRHAAWLLGSKLSYSLLAPPEEAARVKPELAPLASLLGIELPAIDFAVSTSDPEGLARVLSVGRNVGEQMSARHDASHAALVEIAFKSNVLLAAYDKMPHLAHSIGGSVAAASVRAGLPESIWQPWQDSIVTGESVEGVQGAVVELHTQVDSYLRDPPTEATQAILR